jgi:hypothetical protein
MAKSIDDWVTQEEIRLDEQRANGTITEQEYRRELERVYDEARAELDERRNKIERMLNEGYFN